MQHQTTYYRTVKASERKPPPEVELIFIPEEEAPVFGRFRTVGKTDYVILLDISGEEEAYFYKDYVQWLEPIPLPDAERLRDKMQEIADKTEGWKDGIGSVVNRIAREALSAVGDGWIRCEDGLPEDNLMVPVYAVWKATGEVIESDGLTVFRMREKYSHWRPKHIPSPPPPINK